MDFVILDIDLALNTYCLWSWDYSSHALRYAILFFIKGFAINKYAVFIWILGFQWFMQVHQYKYLHDYRRPFSSSKPNEEWPHIALPRHNKSEKERFYMKWLIVDRFNKDHVDVFTKCLKLFLMYIFFMRTNQRLQETKVLELMWMKSLFNYKKKFKLSGLSTLFFKE